MSSIPRHDSQNSNKVGVKLRGIILQSQLYVRARDLFRAISIDTISSEKGQSAVVGTFYKLDTLSVVSDLLNDLNQLHNTLRGTSESVKYFELRF